MFVMRPFRETDLKILLACAKMGKGMTSLPKDPEKLKVLLKLSLASFKSSGTPPSGEYYGFVLENIITQETGGVAAIKAVAGVHKIFRFYRLENDTLIPEIVEEKSSELCSLYLMPDFRKGGLGKLLSLSRLHFIASFQERFTATLMAELRGFLDENGSSPFWEGLGKKLYSLPYAEAALYNAEADPIADKFFSKKPIPLSSLDKAALDCIGNTHPNTAPARKMLEDEGFVWTKRMDIVDAGPQMKAQTSQLKTLKDTSIYRVASKDLPEGDYPLKIISNNRLDFRAVLSQFKINGHEVLLPLATKQALHLKPNDSVRI